MNLNHTKDKSLSATENKRPPNQPNYCFDTLGHADVICGRHKEANNNIGNRRFRILVALSIQRYINAPTRAHKSAVIRDIVDTIRGYGGRFVQSKTKNDGTWEELEEKQIHDKVGHALRDMSSSYEEKSDMKRLLGPLQPILTSPASSFLHNSIATTASNTSNVIYSNKSRNGDMSPLLLNDYTFDCDVEDDWTRCSLITNFSFKDKIQVLSC